MYIPIVGVAMIVFFTYILQLYFSGFFISRYGYRCQVTFGIGQLHPITVNRTIVWVCLTYRHSAHWNATREKIDVSQCVSSALPVVFQWPSSGVPVCPIKQINTGAPLIYHRDLALASVFPVASQSACGSSGLPVWCVQWYPILCRETVCITVKWTWPNGRDNFFHITSGRIST